jgi:hypothetical protein
MSSQKSGDGHVNGEEKNLQRKTTVNLDPLSAAHVYYGESHSKKDKVRTYSSVCLPRPQLYRVHMTDSMDRSYNLLPALQNGWAQNSSSLRDGRATTSKAHSHASS